MKTIVHLLILIFSTYFNWASAQSSLGPWFALEQVAFFKPHVDAAAGYHAKYDIPNMVALGLSWARPTGKGVLHINVFTDRMRIAYTAGQALPRSAIFFNESRHELARLGVRGSYLRRLVLAKRATVLLGPGLGVTGMHVEASEGSGYYTTNVDYRDSLGSIIGSGPSIVNWTHGKREPGSFYPAYGSVHLLLQLRYRPWVRWEIAADICPELTITPWIREAGVHFTSNYTLRSGLGMYYVLTTHE